VGQLFSALLTLTDLPLDGWSYYVPAGMTLLIGGCRQRFGHCFMASLLQLRRKR
jgi:hypothetical protein